MMCVHLCGCVYVFICAPPALFFNNAPRVSRGSDVPKAIACLKKGTNAFKELDLVVSFPNDLQQFTVLVEHVGGPTLARLAGWG